MATMQRGLQHVSRASRLVTAGQRATAPAHVPRVTLAYESRRHASRFQKFQHWFAKQFTPDVKESEKTDVQEAKRQAVQEGRQNIFQAPTQEVAEAQKAALTKGAEVPEVGAGAVLEKPKRGQKTYHEHRYSTGVFKCSHRKLNLLSRQIAGKPIDYAILQMQFSEKRASSRVKNMLMTARDHAVRYKNLDAAKLIVSESWVNKGETEPARVEPRGRAHFGIRRHKKSRMCVVLKQGKTLEEEKAAERKRKLKRIVSAAATREDVPIRNPGAAWAW